MHNGPAAARDAPLNEQGSWNSRLEPMVVSGSAMKVFQRE